MSQCGLELLRYFGATFRLKSERHGSKHQASLKCYTLIRNPKRDRLISRRLDGEDDDGLKNVITTRLDRGATERNAPRTGDELDPICHLGCFFREAQHYCRDPRSWRKNHVWAEQEVAYSTGNIDRSDRRLIGVVSDDEQISSPGELTQPSTGEIIDIAVERTVDNLAARLFEAIPPAADVMGHRGNPHFCKRLDCLRDLRGINFKPKMSGDCLGTFQWVAAFLFRP